MTKIYWTPLDDGTPEMQILFAEPENLFKHLQKTRTGSVHMRCPAFVDFIKNTYVIKSPFNIQIYVNRKTKSLKINGVPETIINKFIINRIHMSGEKSPAVLTLPPSYIFYSDDDVQIETIHAFMETNDSVSNLMLIPGTYNISKWIRAVDFSFEVKNDIKIIDIKKDDVLFYVKFKTKNESKVELERVPMTVELNRAMLSCVYVKNSISNLSLKTLYTMAESFMSTLTFKKTKKCPFGFGKK